MTARHPLDCIICGERVDIEKFGWLFNTDHETGTNSYLHKKCMWNFLLKNVGSVQKLD